MTFHRYLSPWGWFTLAAVVGAIAFVLHCWGVY